MRFFGGGIGHLKNTPPQQVPLASSEEMAVEEDDGDDNPFNSTNGTIVQQSSRDAVMNSATELEVSEGGGGDKEGDRATHHWCQSGRSQPAAAESEIQASRVFFRFCET